MRIMCSEMLLASARSHPTVESKTCRAGETVGMSSRLRKAYVAANHNDVVDPQARARHSEAAAACSSGRISMITPLLPRMSRISSLAILRHRERKRLLSNGGSHRLGSASRQERSRQPSVICHLSFVILRVPIGLSHTYGGNYFSFTKARLYCAKA
jgi:hypothetical protein